MDEVLASSERVRRAMRGQRTRETRPETTLRQALHPRGPRPHGRGAKIGHDTVGCRRPPRQSPGRTTHHELLGESSQDHALALDAISQPYGQWCSRSAMAQRLAASSAEEPMWGADKLLAQPARVGVSARARGHGSPGNVT